MLYRIVNINNGFALFSFKDEYMLSVIDDDNNIIMNSAPREYSAEWQAMEVDFVDGNKLPDIQVAYSRLYLSTKATQALKPFLNWGELLEVCHKGNKGYLFNPLTTQAANTALSLRENHEVKALTFDQELPIFKTDFDGYEGIFCSDEFVQAIDNQGLKGCGFNIDLANIFYDDGSTDKPINH